MIQRLLTHLNHTQPKRRNEHNGHKQYSSSQPVCKYTLITISTNSIKEKQRKLPDFLSLNNNSMAQWFVTNISLQTLYNICINMVDSSERFEGNELSSPYTALFLNCCALWTYHDKFLQIITGQSIYV